MGFLPITRQEMKEQGIEQFDFIYVSGDAYVDHSSFGMAIITRILEAHGYSVGIIAQPDWTKDESITIFGEPKLGFLISSGNMDSMVNHYSSSKKHRKVDAYSPGGKMDLRPDHAVVVYGNLVRKSYKKTPIIIGGIEASLRRLAHYDYWSNSMKRSVLLDSTADLLIYGMGEHAIVEIADALSAGIEIKDITYIAGTVYKTKDSEVAYNAITLPSYEEVKTDKITYAKSFKEQYDNTDPFTAKAMIESYDDNIYVIQNPPAKPLTMQEMDDIYALPYMGTYHPSYEALGGIPAVKEIKFSLVSNRGCFGGCSFCAITFHEGRIVQARSHESILEEANTMTKDPEFKGYIHDLGGPTANFRYPSCKKQLTRGVCKNKQCLYPEPCKDMFVDHKDYIEVLRKLRKLPNVKKVFIRSGVRFDYVLADASDEFLEELCKYHVSGQLRVAPEHISDTVLKRMGKPKKEVYDKFQEKFKEVNEKIDADQYLVPYLISSHPGSTLNEAVKLAEYVRDLGYMPEQVSDFYPTPSTLSTVMYYTGVDPRDMEPVYVPRSFKEKSMQRALIQYRNPKNYDIVKEALELTHRVDLIGYAPKCLIRPERPEKYDKFKKNKDVKEKSKKHNSEKNKNIMNTKGKEKWKKDTTPAKGTWSETKTYKNGKPKSNEKSMEKANTKEPIIQKTQNDKRFHAKAKSKNTMKSNTYSKSKTSKKGQ